MCSQSATINRETGLSHTLDPVWQVEVDRATPAEWSSMLDLFADANLYQTWSYGAVRWGRKNLSQLVLKRDGEVLWDGATQGCSPDKIQLRHGVFAVGSSLSPTWKRA